MKKMKISRFLMLALLITGFNILLIQALPRVIGGQEMAAQDQKMAAQDQKMMEQMMKYGTPGKEHELLKKYVGDWDVEISAWKDATSAPDKSQGTMKNTLIFDGRYLKADFDGEIGGMKSLGLEIIGYDLLKKMYTTFWIDSWSTSFMTTGGTLDASGKVLTETGTFPDPMTDGKTMQKVRNVTTFKDDGSYTFEMYMVDPDGKETKSMEMVCTHKR